VANYWRIPKGFRLKAQQRCCPAKREATLGRNAPPFPTLKGLRLVAAFVMAQPRWGWRFLMDLPRVARSSQPGLKDTIPLGLKNRLTVRPSRAEQAAKGKHLQIPPTPPNYRPPRCGGTLLRSRTTALRDGNPCRMDRGRSLSKNGSRAGHPLNRGCVWPASPSPIRWERAGVRVSRSIFRSAPPRQNAPR
jgi:hypothetical protein